MQSVLLSTILALVLAIYCFRRKKRKDSRKRHFKTSISLDWLEILKQNVPIYSHLPTALRDELHGHIKIFIAEKRFEGCGGLIITDEIKVTIAAQACILLLNRKADYYPKLVTILVYPSSYIAESRGNIGDAVISSPQHRAGESWDMGAVVLSWDDVLHGASDYRDGHNLVFHEFAHQLDQEFGPADGLPRLHNRSQYISWARVLAAEYNSFVAKVKGGHKTLLDPYGSTSPAEFFSVITETFFEKPRALKHSHPDLYSELVQFYNVDPVEWQVEESSPAPFG